MSETEGTYIDYILIMTILFIAVYYDFKTFKIPNRLICLGGVIGLTYNLVTEGFKGLVYSVVWILVTIAILFLLFCFRILGAGDIKLFSIIGSFIFSDVLQVIIISMILATLYGLLLFGIRLVRWIRYKTIHMSFTQIHFSLPIFLGMIIYMVGGVR